MRHRTAIVWLAKVVKWAWSTTKKRKRGLFHQIVHRWIVLRNRQLIRHVKHSKKCRERQPEERSVSEMAMALRKILEFRATSRKPTGFSVLWNSFSSQSFQVCLHCRHQGERSALLVISVSTVRSSTLGPVHQKQHHAIVRVTDWIRHAAMISALPGCILRVLTAEQDLPPPTTAELKAPTWPSNSPAPSPIKHSWDVMDQIQSPPNLPSNTEPDNQRKSSEVQAARGHRGH